MKMTTWLLSAVTALGLLAGTAQAATYNVGVTAVPFRDPGAPGLQTRALRLSNSGSLNLNGTQITTDDLSVGDSFTADIFRLVAFDAGIDADDLVEKPISVTFSFEGLGVVTLMGTTVGSPTGALAVFDPGSISVGGGLEIIVSIATTTFASLNGSYVSGKAGAAPVTATFTLAAVPLPATLSLGLLALGGLAVAGRRRKA